MIIGARLLMRKQPFAAQNPKGLGSAQALADLTGRSAAAEVGSNFLQIDEKLVGEITGQH
jgi:hypothetical protein